MHLANEKKKIGGNPKKYRLKLMVKTKKKKQLKSNNC